MGRFIEPGFIHPMDLERDGKKTNFHKANCFSHILVCLSVVRQINLFGVKWLSGALEAQFKHVHELSDNEALFVVQGRFEILSLSGLYLLTENGGQRSRTGGLSVSLSGPDGRVLGGGVAGLLTAASPVQVLVIIFRTFFIFHIGTALV